MLSIKVDAVLVGCLLVSGCATMPHYDNAQRLIQRADFTPAAQAAPAWVSDALHTINALEYELERPR